jgi:hypothetical protein
LPLYKVSSDNEGLKKEKVMIIEIEEVQETVAIFIFLGALTAIASVSLMMFTISATG